MMQSTNADDIQERESEVRSLKHQYDSIATKDYDKRACILIMMLQKNTEIRFVRFFIGRFVSVL